MNTIIFINAKSFKSKKDQKSYTTIGTINVNDNGNLSYTAENIFVPTEKIMGLDTAVTGSVIELKFDYSNGRVSIGNVYITDTTIDHIDF